MCCNKLIRQKSVTAWFQQLCWYSATRDEKLRTRSQSRPDYSNRADIQPQEMRNFEPEVSHGLIPATVLIFSHKGWETSNQKSVTAWFQQLCWYSATRDEKLRTRSQSGLIPATVLIFSHKRWETSNQTTIWVLTQSAIQHASNSRHISLLKADSIYKFKMT